MNSPQFIDSERVRSVLSWPLVNEAVEEAMKAVSNTARNEPESSYAEQPQRSLTSCGDMSKLLFTMPGHVGNYFLEDRRRNDNTPSVPAAKIRHSTLACKLVTSFPGNALRQPPLANILANIALFSVETGQLECIMDGTQVTAWRTAAASIVATKYLYQSRYSDPAQRPMKVAIIGCGVQGQSHALGMCATFRVTDIRLWNRTNAKAEALADKLRSSVSAETRVHVEQTPSAAVADADVICVGTYSPHALIDAAMITKSNVHINTVGAGQVHFGEVGQDIYDKASVYVDSLHSAKIELKDLKARIVGEVGAVIASGHYPPEQGITIFQSMGMAAEDATVAQAVFEALKGASD